MTTSKEKQLAKALRKLARQVRKIDSIWSNEENSEISLLLEDSYPFQQCFHELAPKVTNWADNTACLISSAYNHGISPRELVDAIYVVKESMYKLYQIEGDVDDWDVELPYIKIYFQPEPGKTPSWEFKYHREDGTLSWSFELPNEIVATFFKK